jgi:putative phosphoserine phosphatase/1-acylglycerol-3-phosphate O-acyltransferase
MTTELDSILARIAQSPEGPETAAFFDFDGTIIDGYSALLVLRHRALRGQIGPGEATRVGWSTFNYLRGAGFEGLMETAVKELRGTPVSELDDLGRRLLKESLGGTMYWEAWQIVAAHRARGHTVVIASSAMPFQIEPLAEELEVHDVLCTRLAVKDGRATGEVDGEILWGAGKANAVRGYAKEHGLDLAGCFGYANGDEDVEFLSTVGRPTAINPGRKLAAKAREEGWPTLHFDGRALPGVTATLRSLAAYGSMGAAFGLGLGVGLLNRSRRQALDLTIGVGSDLALSLAGVDIHLVGEPHLTEVRPAVFIFNHQSWIDPLVAFNLLRHDVTGVGRKDARNPGLAQFAKLANAALVDRADSGEGRRAMQPVVDRLAEGYSIVISPEGTRSPTPRLGPFKKGAFQVAVQAGVPIVPIVLRNSGERLWRGSTVIRPGVLDVAVLAPVPTDGWSVDDLDRHVAEVRDLFVATLRDWPKST